jgi:hypothetical protein
MGKRRHLTYTAGRLKNYKHAVCLYNLAKRRDQRLRQPEAKHELGPRHQQLGRQPLEEAGQALVPRHVAQNAHPGLRVLEVAVLDPCLDHVQRRGHNQRRARPAHRRHEVLPPARRVVVLQAVDVFLGEGGAAEELAELDF